MANEIIISWIGILSIIVFWNWFNSWETRRKIREMNDGD